MRGANLAAIYQAAGMDDLSVREATRAVEADYSNASAHLFLANSYNALRDPKRINLRFETPWFNELLLSNLLSPVGGGPLSQFVSEQEYSKLFESDGFGGSSSTSYTSGTEVQEVASHLRHVRQFQLLGRHRLLLRQREAAEQRDHALGNLRAVEIPNHAARCPLPANEISGRAPGRSPPALRSGCLLAGRALPRAATAGHHPRRLPARVGAGLADAPPRRPALG